ncbi:hypothetical protein DY000_02039409 [Brassica cretica]|uniref:Uncharacterized protein n=1 Tax=Brassica cretica TaxID=69181 RepID=A0ABQ7BQF0_BRACR|nr:hypothetical protein DY000_02039409 [Brassica cretica]
MIAGAQRRLCKPPTSSVIAGAQRRLCKPPTRRLWECRDGLLYAWRYTYIHMRKCGAYMVVVLCTESVVCGLASNTSWSNSPVTHPSFSSLSVVVELFDDQLLVNFPVGFPDELPARFIGELPVGFLVELPVDFSNSEPKSLSLVLQLTIFSRSFQPMTKVKLTSRSDCYRICAFFVPVRLNILFYELLFFLAHVAVGGCSKASVCGDAAFLSCELLLLSFFVSGSEWRCDSSSVSSQVEMRLLAGIPVIKLVWSVLWSGDAAFFVNEPTSYMIATGLHSYQASR